MSSPQVTRIPLGSGLVLCIARDRPAVWLEREGRVLTFPKKRDDSETPR